MPAEPPVKTIGQSLFVDFGENNSDLLLPAGVCSVDLGSHWTGKLVLKRNCCFCFLIVTRPVSYFSETKRMGGGMKAD